MRFSSAPLFTLVLSGLALAGPATVATPAAMYRLVVGGKLVPPAQLQLGVVKVEDGDTLEKLLQRYRIQPDADAKALVLEANPELQSIGLLTGGQQLLLPQGWVAENPTGQASIANLQKTALATEVAWMTPALSTTGGPWDGDKSVSASLPAPLRDPLRDLSQEMTRLVAPGTVISAETLEDFYTDVTELRREFDAVKAGDADAVARLATRTRALTDDTKAAITLQGKQLDYTVEVSIIDPSVPKAMCGLDVKAVSWWNYDFTNDRPRAGAELKDFDNPSSPARTALSRTREWVVWAEWTVQGQRQRSKSLLIGRYFGAPPVRDIRISATPTGGTPCP